MTSKSCSVARAGKVLVVEDDPDVCEMVCRVLQETGYEVDAAATSQAAMRKVRAGDYDLLILDLILPDSDGVILQGKMKRIAPGLETKTIFMTGFTSREPVIEYLRSLSAEFLHKPFGPDDLLRAVRRLS